MNDIAKPDPVDISSEAYRFYTYADGKTFRIDGPVSLYVLPNGSHRIVDGSGLTHRPSPDFVGISWMPQTGQPAFVA
jgi:hypothetical protein